MQCWKVGLGVVLQTVMKILLFHNLLKPTCYVLHQQVNIQQLYALSTVYLCVLYYLTTKSDLCHLHQKLVGFYNRDEKCLLRGTNWVFNLQAPCVLYIGQAFRFSPENVFYILVFNQQIYFII